MEALKLNFNFNLLQTEHSRNLPTADFVQFATECVSAYKRHNSDGYTYRSAIRHFNNFQQQSGKRYQTNELGREELNEFVDFLQEEDGIKNGTASGMLQRIKYMLKKAQQIGYAVDFSFTEANVKLEDVFSIALDKRDVARIFYFDNLSKAQREIRDLFILGCQTGQRYSDYSRFTKEHLQGDVIMLRTQKTKTRVCIPIDKYVREIFERYNYDLPKPRCIQHFNKAIKEICRKAGLTSMISYEVIEKGRVKMVQKEMWKLVSSHTARRTFITTKIAENKPLTSIAKVTGHKSMTCLAMYDKTNLENNAKIMSVASM